MYTLDGQVQEGDEIKIKSVYVGSTCECLHDSVGHNAVNGVNQCAKRPQLDVVGVTNHRLTGGLPVFGFDDVLVSIDQHIDAACSKQEVGVAVAKVMNLGDVKYNRNYAINEIDQILFQDLDFFHELQQLLVNKRNYTMQKIKLLYQIGFV